MNRTDLKYPKLNIPLTPRLMSLPSIAFLSLFVGKLTGIGAVATWSWWWVTLPLWFIPALMFSLPVVGGTIYLILLLLVAILDWFADRKYEKQRKKRMAIKNNSGR